MNNLNVDVLNKMPLYGIESPQSQDRSLEVLTALQALFPSEKPENLLLSVAKELAKNHDTAPYLVSTIKAEALAQETFLQYNYADIVAMIKHPIKVRVQIEKDCDEFDELFDAVTCYVAIEDDHKNSITYAVDGYGHYVVHGSEPIKGCLSEDDALNLIVENPTKSSFSELAGRIHFLCSSNREAESFYDLLHVENSEIPGVAFQFTISPSLGGRSDCAGGS